jgi:transcriptional regulator with PAS, ATPase and Fis domain
MPLELQPKLLRVLQERVFYRLGSEKPQEANFRLISATNRSPLEAVQEGQLREDLYYRINTIEIQVPPLRERDGDIQHLAEHFLHEYAAKYNRPVRAISQQAYERLFAYSWPGNVRELQNVIERAVLLCKGEVIEADALPFGGAAVKTMAANVSTSGVTVAPAPKPVAHEQTAELTFEQLGQIIVSKAPDPKSGQPPVDVFKQIEGAIVTAALERTKGNKQAAANLLGLYRPRLYSLIRKHNLQDYL